MDMPRHRAIAWLETIASPENGCAGITPRDCSACQNQFPDVHKACQEGRAVRSKVALSTLEGMGVDTFNLRQTYGL